MHRRSGGRFTRRRRLIYVSHFGRPILRTGTIPKMVDQSTDQGCSETFSLGASILLDFTAAPINRSIACSTTSFLDKVYCSLHYAVVGYTHGERSMLSILTSDAHQLCLLFLVLSGATVYLTQRRRTPTNRPLQRSNTHTYIYILYVLPSSGLALPQRTKTITRTIALVPSYLVLCRALLSFPYKPF